MTQGTANRTNARTRAINAARAEFVEIAAVRYGRERSGPQSQEEHDAMSADDRAELACWWQESDRQVRQTAVRYSDKIGGPACQQLWIEAQAAVRAA